MRNSPHTHSLQHLVVVGRAYTKYVCNMADIVVCHARIMENTVQTTKFFMFRYWTLVRFRAGVKFSVRIG